MKTNRIISEYSELPLVLTPVDVARLLGVSRNTAYEHFHSKGFPAFRVGRQYRVKRDRFIQWMDESSDAYIKEMYGQIVA